MITLGIDTASKTMSVALFDFEQQQPLASKTLNLKKNHSLTLMPAIKELLSDLNLTPADLAKIIVVAGPGSYTGVRIGVTVAKTLADTLKIPLFTTSSLALLAINVTDYDGLVAPLIDARRDNVYTAIFRVKNAQLTTILKPQHLAIDRLLTTIDPEQNILFLGEDLFKFKEKIRESSLKVDYSTNFLWNYPNSCSLALLEGFVEPVDNISNFTPQYLKLVEAEENWLKKQGSDHIADYQEIQKGYVEKV